MSHDVLVVGAGLAGSVVAARLAAAGARVALVGPAARAGWEGLSKRSVALLAEEGLEQSCGIVDGPFPRSGEWGGRAVVGLEWLVERRALAAGLRARARAAGVDDRRDTVTGLEWQRGQWLAQLRAGGRLAASQVIEARGRRGPERHGPLLLAVGRQFRRRVPRVAGASVLHGTHVHSIDFGWCWWAAQRDALWVQVVGKPRGGRPAMAHPEAWIAAAAAQLPGLAQALAGAVPDGDPAARPAHARLGLAGRYGERGGSRDGSHGAVRDTMQWRVGDAALALDPLSGQGVYEALRGARLVATAVQSVMGGGGAPAAHRFVAERQEEAWIGGVRAAAAFYRENALRGGFWSDTADAYERLLPAAPPVAPHLERRPVLCDGRILERDVIVTAQHPRGVWHVADVPLVSLKGYLESAQHATVSGAAAAVDRPAAAVAAAIYWLQQAGIMGRQVRPGAPLGG